MGQNKIWLKAKISKENSKKVHNYKINKDFTNLGEALDDILTKFFKKKIK